MDSRIKKAESGNIYGCSAILKSGTITSDETWSASSAPYLISQAGVEIPEGVTLTIDPGVIVKFSSTDSKISVNGQLRAIGEEEDKIYFTSLYDNISGEYTVTSSSPAAGDWDTIQLNEGASSTISYAVVRYGDYGNNGALYNNGGDLSLNGSEVATSTNGVGQLSGTSTIASSDIHHQTNSGIRIEGGSVDVYQNKIHHQTRGIYMEGGLLTISGSAIYSNGKGLRYNGGSAHVEDCAIYSNTSYGIENVTEVSVVAFNNFWGNSTGPTHSSNPSGIGDVITDYVSYDPWRLVNYYWSVRNFALKWYDITLYGAAWDGAVDTWNTSTGVGRIEVSTTSEMSSSTASLLITDEQDLPNGWAGMTVVTSVPEVIDRIVFSIDDMNYFEDQYDEDAWYYEQHVATHELGHALGLADRNDDSANMMFNNMSNGSSITLGDEDKDEYDFLWNTIDFISPSWWVE